MRSEVAVFIEKCNLSDVIVLEPNIFQDNRGFFSEVYNKQIQLKHLNIKICPYMASILI